MFKKRELSLCLLLFAVFSLVALSVSAESKAAPKPVTIKALTAWSLKINATAMFRKYVEVLNSRTTATGRKVTIKILGGPEVVKPFEAFQALRTGFADLLQSTAGYYSGEVIEGATLSMLGWDYDKYLEAWRKTEALNILNEAYRKKSKTIILAPQFGGAVDMHMLLAKDINSLADIKGMRIRIFSAMLAKVVKSLGASPQRMPPAELYQGLQRGVVDGAIRSAADAWGYGERDVYKTIIKPPLFLIGGSLFYGAKAWDKLPEDVRQLLNDVAIELEPQVMTYFHEVNEQGTAELLKTGSKIYRLTPAEINRVNQARLAYWDEIVKRSPDYGSRLRKILERY